VFTTFHITGAPALLSDCSHSAGLSLQTSQGIMSESREASPSAEERRKKDKEDRKREEEEQAKLPYKWTQTLTEAEISTPIPDNLKARDLIVELKKTHIKVQIKGQEPIIDVGLSPYSHGQNYIQYLSFGRHHLSS
jgi:hypothetical protein